jgi:hypothetical protein
MKCAKCGLVIPETANRMAVKVYGGRAEFRFACFGSFLRDGAADELERRAWRESTTAQPAAPAAGKARGEKYQDEPD